MRHLILLLIGLAVGALGAASAVNALRLRDAYPRGLMQVMQHHLAALREDASRGRCGTTAAPHLAVLRAMAQEIPSAIYADATPDAQFSEFHRRLRDALAAGTFADCSAARASVASIGSACDACHRKFR
jgi:hypothetical protein